MVWWNPRSWFKAKIIRVPPKRNYFEALDDTKDVAKRLIQKGDAVYPSGQRRVGADC